MKMTGQTLTMVCFGGEDWWYHNRGHFDFQLMKKFAENNTVLYINSIVMQMPKLSQKKRFLEKLLRKIKSILTGLKKSSAGFWVYSPLSLPLHHIGWARWINSRLLQFQIWCVLKKLGIRDFILWVACPSACDVAIRMKKYKLVYQRTDVYELYPDVPREIIRGYDLKLKAESDLTIFVSRALYNREATLCRKAVYLDHGVDYEKFGYADRLKTVPPDIAGIAGPIVGFFGSINGRNTVDIELLEKLAILLPDMSFVLIGKVAANYTNLLPKKNIWMLGQKPYEQIPYYGRCFDVAILPWRQNEWIIGSFHGLERGIIAVVLI